MSHEQRMEKASQLKEEGNAEFIKGDHQAAASLYKKAAHLYYHGANLVKMML